MKQVEVNAENFKICLFITNRINKLLKNIKDETAMFSTSNHILAHPAYIILKGMGPRLVPYLIHCILEYGSDWVILHLLHDITNVTPYEKNDAGKFGVITARWLLWYDTWEKKATDVYFGLLNDE